MEPDSAWTLVRTNQRFRRLWAAQLVSMGGDFISQVALSALLFQMTGRATMVAALAVATNLPVFLATPWAGVAADRFDRLRLMVACDLARAVLVLGLLAVAPSGQAWLALVVVALMETVSAFFEPASSAALPNLVEPAQMSAAVSLSSASWSTMLAVGAALGGLIATTLGMQAAFLANSASFLVSALLIGSLRQPVPETRRQAKLRFWADLLEGFEHVRRRPRLLALLLIKVFWGLGSGVLALLTVLPMQVLGAGEAGVASLFSARGLGAVGGPLLAQIFARYPLTARARLAAVGVVMTGLCYGLLAQAPSLALAALWVVLAHIGSGVQWVLSTVLLQQSLDDDFRGRVLAFDYAGVTLAMSVSTLAFGKAIDHFGPRLVGTMGGGLLVALGLLWLLAFGWLRRDLLQAHS